MNKAVKPNSIICDLVAAFFITLFCFSNPVFAADFGTSKPAVNSYQKNLSRLRANQVVEPERFFEKEITRFPRNASPLPQATPAIDSLLIPEENTKEEITKKEDTKEETTKRPFADTSINTSNNRSQKARSPYAIIAAARQPNHSTPNVFDPSRFANQLSKQLPRQLSQLHTALQEQPAQIIHVVRQVKPAIERRANSASGRIRQIPQSIKSAISNALDRAGTRAHQTADQLRQTNPQ